MEMRSIWGKMTMILEQTNRIMEGHLIRSSFTATEISLIALPVAIISWPQTPRSLTEILSKSSRLTNYTKYFKVKILMRFSQWERRLSDIMSVLNEAIFRDLKSARKHPLYRSKERDSSLKNGSAKGRRSRLTNKTSLKISSI